MKGKTIRIFLVDGVPGGTLTAEIINWSGKIVVAPRSQLAELGKRYETGRTGAYCLVGPDPDAPESDLVYIGESDNVFKRLRDHDKVESKDFWTRTIVIISKDENLTKSHIRYLESRLIQLAKAAGRAKLTNDTNPDPSQLPESDIADMEFFLDQVQMVLPVLGFNFTQPKPRIPIPDELPGAAGVAEQSPVFEINSVGIHATAQEIDGEMIVQAGSTARKQGVASWTSYRSLRDRLVSEGKLIESDDPEYYQFAEDIAFSSPSAAAAVIMAANTNGRSHWKIVGTSRTYQHWQEKRLEEVDADQDGGLFGVNQDEQVIHSTES